MHRLASSRQPNQTQSLPLGARASNATLSSSSSSSYTAGVGGESAWADGVSRGTMDVHGSALGWAPAPAPTPAPPLARYQHPPPQGADLYSGVGGGFGSLQGQWNGTSFNSQAAALLYQQQFQQFYQQQFQLYHPLQHVGAGLAGPLHIPIRQAVPGLPSQAPVFPAFQAVGSATGRSGEPQRQLRSVGSGAVRQRTEGHDESKWDEEAPTKKRTVSGPPHKYV